MSRRQCLTSSVMLESAEDAIRCDVRNFFFQNLIITNIFKNIKFHNLFLDTSVGDIHEYHKEVIP